MRSEIRLWQVTDGKLKQLPACSFQSAHKEKDLEEWVESDPSILGRELTVIGRQLYIPKVGPLDLLAVDDKGRLVLVEFKREQTTRETIAQILDYASAIRKMDIEQLLSMANVDKEEIGEILEFDPIMMLVAADADEAAERIVDYLSTKAGITIEIVTFTYSTLPDGKEVIARSLIIPEISSSLHVPQSRINTVEMIKIAEERKIAPLIEVMRRVRGFWYEETLRSNGGEFRYWVTLPDGKEKVILNIYVGGEKFGATTNVLDICAHPEVLSQIGGVSTDEAWGELQKFDYFKETAHRIFIHIKNADEANKVCGLFEQWALNESKPS